MSPTDKLSTHCRIRTAGRYMVDEMRRALGHPPAAAARADRARFARERHQAFRVARIAAEAREAVRPDATS